MPGLALSTDVIVGFPGEQEEDFLQTLSLVREAAFSSAFTFIYSKRPGTPAAKIDDPTPHEVIQDRFDRLAAQVALQAHGLAAHPEDEGAGITDDARGKREGLLDVLLGKDGRAGSDPANERKRDQVVVKVLDDVDDLGPRLRLRVLLLDDFDGAWLLGVAVDETLLLEGLEVHMDR